MSLRDALFAPYLVPVLVLDNLGTLNPAGQGDVDVAAVELDALGRGGGIPLALGEVADLVLLRGDGLGDLAAVLEILRPYKQRQKKVCEQCANSSFFLCRGVDWPNLQSPAYSLRSYSEM